MRPTGDLGQAHPEGPGRHHAKADHKDRRGISNARKLAINETKRGVNLMGLDEAIQGAAVEAAEKEIAWQLARLRNGGVR